MSISFPGQSYTNIGNYTVFAGNTITSTGVSVVTGNMGVGSAQGPISGFNRGGIPPGQGTCSGNIDFAATVANTELNNLATAILAVIDKQPFLPSSNLGPAYGPGVYWSDGTAINANGTVTLTGNATDQFFFIAKGGGSLNFGNTTPANIVLAGGALAKNVFWLTTTNCTYYGASNIRGIIISGSGTTVTGSGATITGANYSQAGIQLSDTTVTSFSPQPVPCYNKGTQILTEHGYRNVETIKAGDRIQTFGQFFYSKLIPLNPILQTCKTILRRNVDVPTEESGLICFKPGSLGENLPESILYVSPDHGMVVDGFLIAAKDLVNGTTVFQDLTTKDIEYYHLELETHACIKANGALADSFLR